MNKASSAVHCARRVYLVFALSLAHLFGQASVVHAAHSITVCASGCDHATIQAAIDAAPPKAIIRVGRGIYVEHLALYDKHVTLDGEAAAKTIISGGNTGRVIFLYANSTLTVTNMTIRDGVIADNQGGGIYNDGVLTVEDSRIADNRAGLSGGGIANFGTLRVNRSLIVGNSAAVGNGGGIVNGGRVTVTASTIVRNYARLRGGGIYHSVGTFALTGSSVADNRADVGGGGIANFDYMSTSNSTVAANRTEGAGGGIVNGGHLTVADLTLASNRASDGSGFYNSGTLVLGNVTVAGEGANCTNWGVVIDVSSSPTSSALCRPGAANELSIIQPT
jgi:hypothetical protein